MGAVVVVGLALAVLRTSSLRLMGVVVLVAYAALLASTSVAIQPSPWPFVRGYAIAAWLSLAILTLPRLIPAPLVVGLPSDMIFRLYRVVRSGRPMTMREVRAFGGFVYGMLDIAGGIGGFVARGWARAGAGSTVERGRKDEARTLKPL